MTKMKEAWSIAGIMFGGFAVAVLIAYALGLVANKAFSNHLWPRLFVAASIVAVVTVLFFSRRGTGQPGRK